MNLTPTGFGIIVAILLIVAVIVVVAQNLRDRREDVQDDTEYPWPMRLRDTCDLESCCEPPVVEFAGGKGPLYICAKHAGPVSAWAPVVGVRMPYDQEDGVA